MRRTKLALLTALLALAAPPLAQAESGTNQTIHRQCADGKITGRFSQKQLAEALKTIPTDVDEYTDCRDVIRRAQLSAAGTTTKKDSSTGGAATPGGGGSGGGTSAPGAAATPSAGAAGGTVAQILAQASPAEQAAVSQAVQSSGDTPVSVGGEAVSADTSGLSPAGAANKLPTPLIVALLLLAVALGAGGAQTLRSLAHARRSATP